jgi:hypothetical protein
MAGLTVGDNAEWEEIKMDFVNGGASSRSRITAIQRLAKECAVCMEDAEEVADREARERGEEARKVRKKFTIGGASRWRFGRGK